MCRKLKRPLSRRVRVIVAGSSFLDWVLGRHPCLSALEFKRYATTETELQRIFVITERWTRPLYLIITPAHLQLPQVEATAKMGWALSGRDFSLGIVVGVVATLVLSAAVFVAVLRMSDIYSLGHWKLNLRTPMNSMWMNLGYWYVHWCSYWHV